MPAVDVAYYGLIRAAAACSRETFAVDASATVRDLLLQIVRRHGEARFYLLSDDGMSLATGAVVRIGRFAARDLDAPIGSGETVEVVVMSPMLVGG